MKPMSHPVRKALGDIGTQAIGHFFYKWKEDSAPAIIDPYRNLYCDTRYGNAYSEFSAFLLDHEFAILEILNSDILATDDFRFLCWIGKQCDEILNMIDREQKVGA